MVELQERSSSPVPHPDPGAQANGKRGHDDDDLLQSLQKRVDESGELLKGIAQRHPVAGNVAYANYLRDIVVCMSRTKFRKARSSFNQILTVLLDEDSDPEEAPTAYAFPARPPMPSTIAIEKVQQMQSRDQQKSDQCHSMMLHPSHHVYKRLTPVPVEQPGSASSPASMGSPGPQASCSHSDVETSTQSFSNISGFSTLLNMSSEPIATSTPCVQTVQQDPQHKAN